MRLTPTEIDRLLIFTAAQVARGRLARGLALNHPEAVALIASEVIEAARDGVDYDTAVERGRSALRVDQVLDGVADMVDSVSVEAVFADGTKLVQLARPIGGDSDASR
jgi:urease subunit gamma/beta